MKKCETCKKEYVECMCLYDRRDLWRARVQNMEAHVNRLKKDLVDIEAEILERKEYLDNYYRSAGSDS